MCCPNFYLKVSQQLEEWSGDNPSKNTPRVSRLFRDIGWSFLVDSVRVRPLHEEMTAGLLEEVEKRRAQKTSRTSGLSTARDPPEFAKVVMAATAANAAKAPNSPYASGVGPADIAGAPSESPTFAGSMAAVPGPAPPSGSATRLIAAPSVGSHPPGAAVPIDKSGDVGRIGKVVLGADGQTPSLKDDRVEAVEPEEAAAAAAAAAAKRRLEAERRRAALATIEKHRSHRHAAPAATTHAAASAAASTEGSVTLPPDEVQHGAQELGTGTKSVSTMSATHAASCTSSRTGAAATSKPSLSMSTAFSRQSVRSGETLGYYGREEVDVLSAISKNPSRIAAYNRITQGKTSNKEDGPSPEVKRGRRVRRKRVSC